MQKSLLSFYSLQQPLRLPSVHASGACTNPSPGAVKTAAVVKSRFR